MESTQYTKGQYSSGYPKGIEKNFWNSARNSIIIDFLEKLKLKKKRILEIGSGEGIVLRALRSSRFDCYGVEPADLPVSQDLKDFMYTGISFEALEPALCASFEVVLLLDVIEHIENDRLFLEKVVQKFPKLTHIIITVPARSELWSNFDTHYGHFRRYSLSSLKSVLKASGLELSFASYFFHLLYIPSYIMSLVKMHRNTTLLPPRGYQIHLHKILSWVFFNEYLYFPSRLVGTSIIGMSVLKK